MHFGSNKQFYINVDVNKEFALKIMIYHFKQTIVSSNYLVRVTMQLIMFLNKRITNSKSKYWSIEPKIVNLMWILRKTRHMIDFAFWFFIIYTNHEVAVNINRQKFLFTFFTDKLNLRLIKTSKYIQKFNVIIKHKSKEKHVVLNALFKLKIEFTQKKNHEKNKLNILLTKKKLINFFSIVEISADFRNKIIKDYPNESIWIKALNIAAKTTKNGTNIFFHEKKRISLFWKK